MPWVRVPGEPVDTPADGHRQRAPSRLGRRHHVLLPPTSVGALTMRRSFSRDLLALDVLGWGGTGLGQDAPAPREEVRIHGAAYA